jgi:hypothetical protein
LNANFDLKELIRDKKVDFKFSRFSENDFIKENGDE